MSDKEAVLYEIENLPENLLPEVLEHVRQLKLSGALERSPTAIASEQVLAKDWMLKEEDDAWRDL
ncbi:MAG TPA: hypothetical protein VFW87_01755 [Pirellulales bacterium]|nr:hypothetical protein [Pirellulales bacterium]